MKRPPLRPRPPRWRFPLLALVVGMFLLLLWATGAVAAAPS